MKNDALLMGRFWLPVAAWCGLIFALSSVPGLESGLSWDFTLRKGAHMFEYAVLFLLIRRALAGTTQFSRGACVSTAVMLAVLYAVSDEFHQSFVPNRGASSFDVMIDAVGALVATFIKNDEKIFSLAPVRLLFGRLRG